MPSRGTIIFVAVVIVVGILGYQAGKSTNLPAACPTTPATASRLFGGGSGIWAKADSGWTATPPSARQVINVPPWYARVLTNAAGEIQMAGAPSIKITVTLTSGDTLTLLCPSQ